VKVNTNKLACFGAALITISQLHTVLILARFLHADFRHSLNLDSEELRFLLALQMGRVLLYTP